MNVFLTVFFVVAVLLAMAAAILALDDVEEGVIFPWQFGVSFAIGLCITHGQFLDQVFTWANSRLSRDGLAGVAMSVIAAGAAECVMAGLPMLAGVAVYAAVSKLDKYWPLLHHPMQTRRGKMITFLRGFCLR